MRNRKKLIALLLSFVMIISITACGSKNSKDNGKGTEAKKSSTSNELTYWYWADNSEYSSLMKEIVTKFNESNESGIIVKAEEYPWDGGGYSQNLFTAAMGGGGPDMATFKLTSAPLFANNDLLLNLDEELKEWEGKTDIADNIWDIMSEATPDVEGTYVMPWNIQVLYVYYRPSQFKEAGIEIPETYAEFLDACEKLTSDTDGDGKIDRYGFGMRGSTGGQEPWGSFIHAYGGSFDDLNNEKAVKGMEDFVNLYKNKQAQPTAPADGFNEMLENFKAGRTAMMIHHTGSSAGLKEALGDDVAAFKFPVGEGGQWTSMGDTDNIIFKSVANKEGALEFVKYMAIGEGQKMWCEGTRNVPVSKTVQEQEFFQSDEFMKVSIESIDFAGILPVLDTTTEWINTTWPNTISQSLSGDITSKEAMEILNKALYD